SPGLFTRGGLNMQATTEPTGGAAMLRSAKRAALPLLSRLAAAEHALSGESTERGQPPGYGGFFPSLYCSVSALLGNLLELLVELEHRFGGGERMLPVRFNFLGKPSVLVTNPRHIHQVF